ncbi:hypothetical protein S1OALGB6SA_191 [Olavius algarvensis spirochete endosymbiont]|uniref:spiro-SPASM protein n=1 Tax=Olavius algarvensis spirochete endosymbiont TaxID=260710 RepID=UPI000F0F0FB9|nr:spiro-SPASM protein [Olavius algarvensis spirochete endosymbiont]VDA99129.1 hypothetical protein S1OALGB6SA_191 [Olavius algarvensis spirochete endosymbiont]
MGNLAVVNIVNSSPLTYQPVFGGPSAFERVISWTRLIPEITGVVLLADREVELPGEAIEIQKDSVDHSLTSMRVIRKSNWTDKILIEALETAVQGSTGLDEITALFYVWGDSPLIDPKLSEKLWSLHYKYNADYTFADGYPLGLTPEILASTLPKRLLPYAEDRELPPSRDSIFEVLRKDINSFNVETHLSKKDLRMDRISITCDTQRNLNIADKLYRQGATDAESLCEIIPRSQLLLRDIPAFFPIQITNHCPQACSYCPFPRVYGDPRKGNLHIETSKFAELCRRIVEFAPDAVFGLSLWGEPASHPDIRELIDIALGPSTSRTRLLVETSAIGWSYEMLKNMALEVDKRRIMWIVSLDAADSALYEKLRGKGREEAEATAELLVGLFGSSCWIQAVRMKDNEEHLRVFHQNWKNKGAQTIIQKYNSFAAYLPELQPSNLSPLQRFPCWHLKRDMPILLDGTVPICREDIRGKNILGNAFEENLEKIWNSGDVLYRKHVADVYPEPCANCDEYYTFNF